MKHKTARRLILELLEEGDMNTHEIYFALKERMRWAPTMNALSNILGKNKDVRVVLANDAIGAIRVNGGLSNGHSITLWGLKRRS